MSPILRNVILYSLRGVEAGFAIAIPYIAVFYAILSIFEDSGYLTRAAFLLDNLTHKLGLHGRAVIPLVLGFGCNVPAIMAVHALGTRREKEDSFHSHIPYSLLSQDSYYTGLCWNFRRIFGLQFQSMFWRSLSSRPWAGFQERVF